MTDETKVLLAIRDYYISTRQIGHTHAMLNGASNVDSCIVLVHNNSMKQLLKAMTNKSIDTISLQDPTGLLSKRKPLLIDNAAFTILIDSALQRIAELEKENYALKDMIK